jgi:hypothetical protein
MKLDASKAIVPVEKLRDYLLSPTHRTGRCKAAYFRSLGYTQEEWRLLEADLLAMLRDATEPAEVSPYGHKFIVHGVLVGPSGRSARIVAVWTILTGEVAPRFVTAYPEV